MPTTMDLRSTLNLPKTDFPMKANLPQAEPRRLEKWKAEGLYGRVRKAREGRPSFVLHDGPPYANGHIHLGTALNKILKDVVVRSRSMAGNDSPYVPGWDCHGLPIELQVDRSLGPKKKEMSAVAFRRACRAHAEKFVKIQREEFERLGVQGEWEDPYLTMSPGYQATIVRQLASFVEKDLVYKAKKSVYWCISDRTALAEAEVEYDEKHVSPSIDVRFALPRAECDKLAERHSALGRATASRRSSGRRLRGPSPPTWPWPSIPKPTTGFIRSKGRETSSWSAKAARGERRAGVGASPLALPSPRPRARRSRACNSATPGSTATPRACSGTT